MITFSTIIKVNFVLTIIVEVITELITKISSFTLTDPVITAIVYYFISIIS